MTNKKEFNDLIKQYIESDYTVEKANVFFNNGNIEDAKRIYITTGYSDGLTRVGDYYMNNNEPLKALKVYYLAHNKRDSEPIFESIAKVISSIIKE